MAYKEVYLSVLVDSSRRAI